MKFISVAIFLLIVSCGSDEKSTPSSEVTVTKNSMFFVACEGGCASTDYKLYEYSFEDSSLSIVGNNFFNIDNYGGSQGNKYFASGDNVLYFTANTSQGNELWAYDPREAQSSGINPKMIFDINQGGDSEVAALAFHGGKLYFSADDGVNGFEPWCFDPSRPVSIGTNPFMLGNLNNGSDNSSPNSFTLLGGKVYFKARGTGVGFEIFVYDPNVALSAANPKILVDLNPSSSASSVSFLISHRDKLYFKGDNGVLNDREVWVYDPSLAVSFGTNPKVLAQIHPTGDSDAAFLTSIGDYLFINAGDGVNGHDLWVYDDREVVSVGTNPYLVDLVPGSGTGGPFSFTSVQGKGYMTTTTASNGQEMAIFDPREPISASNPEYIDSMPGADSGRPQNFIYFNNLIFFTGNDTVTHSGKYVSVLNPQNPVSNWGTENPNYLQVPLIDFAYSFVGLSYSVAKEN